MKTLTAISPSQIETFHAPPGSTSGCNRKWWLNKILGLPIPQHPSAALGEQVHKGQETYLETGDPSVIHPLAKGTLPILEALRARQQASGRVFMERALKRQLRNGLLMNGRIDILDATSVPFLVLDWKTTSNPAYAKTEEELKSNVQMLTYAYEATVLDIELNGAGTGRNPVEVAHVVIPTKGGTAPFMRRASLPLDEIHAGWRRIQDISDTMLAVSKIEDPRDVTPNLSACSAFGGCAFRERCAALKRIAVPVPTTPDPVTQEDPMPIPSASYQSALSIFQTEAALKQMFGSSMTPEEFETWKAGGAAPAPAPAPAVQAQRGINPPEAGDPRAPAPVQVAAPAPVAATADEKADLLESLGWEEDDLSSLTDEAFEQAVKLNLKFEDAEYDKVENPTSPTGFDYVNVRKRKPVKAAPAAVETPAPAEPTVRRRGRPPGSKNKATLEAEAAAQATATAAEPPVDQVWVHTPSTGLWTLMNRNKPTFAQETAGRVVVGYDTDKAAYLAKLAAPAETTPKPAAAGVDYAALQAAHKVEVETQAQRALAAEERERKALARVAELEAALAGARSAPAPDAKERLVLYIDCLPEKGGAYRLLDDALAPFMKLAAENYTDEKTGKTTPVTHYSLIPFGKGPGMVAAYVLANIREVATGTLVCDTRSPAAAAVLEVLRPMADVVVRGMGR